MKISYLWGGELPNKSFCEAREAPNSYSGSHFSFWCKIFVFIGLSALSVTVIFAQKYDSVWSADSDFPASKQFIARLSNEQGIMRLGGRIFRTDADSVFCQSYFNGLPYKRLSQPLHIFKQIRDKKLRKNVLVRMDTSAECSRKFEFSCGLEARPGVYSFELGLRFVAGKNVCDTVFTRHDSLVCGDVVLVSGQSNVVLGTPVAPLDDFGRTFLDTSGSIIPLGYDVAMTRPHWQSTKTAHALGYTVGGLAMGIQREILSHLGVPLCIMNGGVNATILKRHLPDNALPRDTVTTIYGNLLHRMECSRMQAFPKVLVWYQGESNVLDSAYLHDFQILYSSWLRDYPSLQKIYIVQIHSSNCLPNPHGALKEMQRRLGNLSPKITVVATNAVPFHDGCHFRDSGYAVLAERVSALMLRDVYCLNELQNLDSPSLEKAFWLDSTHQRLCLKFSPQSDAPLVISTDTLVGGETRTIADMFLFDGSNTQIRDKIKSLEALGNDALVMTLGEALPSGTHISYAAEAFYPHTQTVVQGPWIQNRRGVGALSFYDIVIEEPEKK